MNTIDTNIVYTQELKDIVNNSITDIIISMLNSKTVFSIIVSNKYWSKPLPSAVANQSYFFVQINDQTMEDSFYDMDTGEIILNTKFGEEDNSLVLYAENVKGIFDITMQIPLMLKPFDDAKFVNIEKAKVINKNAFDNFSDEELTEGVKNSIDAFVKNNPDKFGK
jgi:hypothetical protein